MTYLFNCPYCPEERKEKNSVGEADFLNSKIREKHNFQPAQLEQYLTAFSLTDNVTNDRQPHCMIVIISQALILFTAQGNEKQVSRKHIKYLSNYGNVDQVQVEELNTCVLN